jgi:hypothetical protein
MTALASSQSTLLAATASHTAAVATRRVYDLSRAALPGLVILSVPVRLSNIHVVQDDELAFTAQPSAAAASITVTPVAVVEASARPSEGSDDASEGSVSTRAKKSAPAAKRKRR